ncbi:MAG: hypothetical protein ACNA8P_12850, partial [Phycisphaerales bacterium]
WERVVLVASLLVLASLGALAIGGMAYGYHIAAVRKTAIHQFVEMARAEPAPERQYSMRDVLTPAKPNGSFEAEVDGEKIWLNRFRGPGYYCYLASMDWKVIGMMLVHDQSGTTEWIALKDEVVSEAEMIEMIREARWEWTDSSTRDAPGS